jgi:two-component system OmpR family response regulator
MNEVKHIVTVDDDKEIRKLLTDFLTQHGYKVSAAKNAKELYDLLEKDNTIQLVILDIMMPGVDGLDICKHLRTHSNQIPIIIASGVCEVTDRIIGLELGADDYVVKPFNPRELLVRIKAVLRRAQTLSKASSENPQQGNLLHFCDWTLNTANRQLLSPDNIEISLSGRAYDLLVVFLEHAQRVLSRDQLLTILSNRTAEPFDRSIDVQVSRLRQKLGDDPKEPKLIKTVRTGGYLFAASVKRA